MSLPGPSIHPGRWWSRLADGRVHCDLCPRGCSLKPGQKGFCYVREATEDGMVLTTYGRSSGFCVDPVEKKPLNHFLPGTPILSFGTAGCNLGCKFCQNWDISKARKDDKLMASASPERIAEAAVRAGCSSVAFTYNDPVIFAEYAIDTAIACRERGIRPVAVTAGYITAAARPEFYAAMDAANVDLKGFTEDFYQRQSMAHLAPVLETLEWVAKESRIWLEITTLLIPGLNDSDTEVGAMCEWIADRLGSEVPLHFTAFHPDFKMMDRPHTPPETLRRAREIGRKAGLQFVYTGNVRDLDGGTTYCPGCGSALIVRDYYDVVSYGLKASACGQCGRAIPGVFGEAAGKWGTRRVPLAV